MTIIAAFIATICALSAGLYLGAVLERRRIKARFRRIYSHLEN